MKDEDQAAVKLSEFNAGLDRVLRCSFCGHTVEGSGIGAVYCGPHKVADAYFPAIRMLEIVSNG